MSQENSGKSPAESFAEMLRRFGDALSGILQEPALKEKSDDFAQSAARAVETLPDRVKGEELQVKYQDIAAAAKEFGGNVSARFGTPAGAGRTEESIPPVIPAGPKVSQRAARRRGDIFETTRPGRVVASIFTIAWDIALLIFFNFYNQYIAYYQQNGAGNWVQYPILTSAFPTWLVVLNTGLVISIVGHIIAIIFDSYVLRLGVLVVLDLVSAGVVFNLVNIFPFDFSKVPNTTMATVLPVAVTIILIFIGIGFVIGGIVRLIRLIRTLIYGEHYR